jgi:site-specific recombinase XerD
MSVAALIHPYLFLAQGNAPLSVGTVDHLLKLLGKQARVKNVHAHRFRHTFAIHQLLAGTSAFVLMQLLGHSTLESTKMYVRALSQMQARAASVSVVDEWRKKKR